MIAESRRRGGVPITFEHARLACYALKANRRQNLCITLDKLRYFLEFAGDGALSLPPLSLLSDAE